MEIIDKATQNWTTIGQVQQGVDGV